MITMKYVKEYDEELYVSLAVQTVLHENARSLDLKQEDIFNIADQVQDEIILFKKAAEAVQSPSGKVIPQMRFILAHLQDEHLSSSYFEARSLGLDSEFVQMLRTEIIRRGITYLKREDLEH
ncbi:hypothetical protein COHCIP112018_04538 [Cohnella sp. JJ-181]|nr:hypothetical protein COHCIP112018_04538 [Cohnella sp. JJ-181]